MADFTKSTDLKFSYEALEVACHAIEQYCQRLRLGQAKKLIVCHSKWPTVYIIGNDC